MKSTFVFLGILCLCPALSQALQKEVQDEMPAVEGESIEQLASSVRDLGLGEGAFVVGSYLTQEQIEQAQGNLLADTYPGTIKFSSGDVVVVADEKTHLILALYQRREEIHADDVKQMVGYLMTRFGEPTTMGHGKLIYWAFGKAGKIDGETYLESKATGEIDILATVKFNSTLDLNPGMDNDNMEETGTIYYIITSDRLLDSYLNTP
jgi:hypothetical protein